MSEVLTKEIIHDWITKGEPTKDEKALISSHEALRAQVEQFKSGATHELLDNRVSELEGKLEVAVKVLEFYAKDPLGTYAKEALLQITERVEK